MLFGLAALVVALVGLVRGHVSWARIVSRKTAATTAVAALVVISVGGALSPSEPKNSATSSALPLSASPAPATPTPTPTPTPRISYAPDGTAMPDRILTPGSALVSAAAVVCAPGYPASVSDVSEDVRRGVFAAYAVDYAQRDGYQLDHLVPVELGGDNSERNLWPQPRTGPGAAEVKDGLEIHLHDLVCAAMVPLAEAQQAIAGDWSAASAKYGPMTVPSPPAAATTAPPPPAPASPGEPPPPTYIVPQPPQPPAPQRSTAPPVQPAPPAPQRSTAPPVGGNVVHSGAFCTPAGAIGVTVGGTPMVCGPASDGRNRWHSR